MPSAHGDMKIVFWIVVGIQLVGLASAWLARLSIGCRAQRSCQWVFFFCLLLVGGTSVASLAVLPENWLLSSLTLALMILATVWDFGVSGEAETA